MAIRLRLTFTGLFLFVPDGANNLLHVLLPETGGPIHPHTARIGKQGSEVTFGDEDLELVGTGAGADVLEAPEETVKLHAITKKQLEKDQIKRGKRPRIHASIILPRATMMLPGQRPALFDVPVLGTREMSHQVEWTLDNLDQAKAVFRRLPYKRSDAADLSFDPDGDALHLCISHLPEHEEKPKKGDEATHFQAYYRVYKASVSSGNPKLAEDPVDVPTHHCFPAKGASTFTCMTAQVVPE